MADEADQVETGPPVSPTRRGRGWPSTPTRTPAGSCLRSSRPRRRAMPRRWPSASPGVSSSARPASGGELGAGPMRMNRVTVRRATAGLVRYLLAHEPGSAERGIVIGYDARHKSDAFAHDGRGGRRLGMKAMLMPGAGPTPVLAWSVPTSGRRRGDGHRQPQPAPRQRVQGVPRGRVADRLAGRRRHRRRDRRRRPGSDRAWRRPTIRSSSNSTPPRSRPTSTPSRGAARAGAR